MKYILTFIALATFAFGQTVIKDDKAPVAPTGVTETISYVTSASLHGVSFTEPQQLYIGGVSINYRTGEVKYPADLANPSKVFWDGVEKYILHKDDMDKLITLLQNDTVLRLTKEQLADEMAFFADVEQRFPTEDKAGARLAKQYRRRLSQIGRFLNDRLVGNKKAESELNLIPLKDLHQFDAAAVRWKEAKKP